MRPIETLEQFAARLRERIRVLRDRADDLELDAESAVVRLLHRAASGICTGRLGTAARDARDAEADTLALEEGRR